MPTPPKSLGNMRKHLTNAEKQARQQAEDKLVRGKRVYIPAPRHLSAAARAIFEKTKREMRELGTLDPLDGEMLALYADAVATYWELKKISDPSDQKAHATMQAWLRSAAGLAEKLGVTVQGRARLAKKAAEQQPADDLEQLLNDVVDYVNEGNVR